MSKRDELIVSAEWLQANLDRPGLSIVDASWYLPTANRNAFDEYRRAHIPGAVFFDHDEVADKSTGLPHSVPKPRQFARAVGAMGIAVDDEIVIYDGPGLFSSARAWWLFRVMGATNVKILDGGFKRWSEEGRPVSDQPTKIAPCHFKESPDLDRVVSIAEMRNIVETASVQIADARPAGRFSGRDNEPRPGMRGGHMPGALNVQASDLSKDGSLVSEQDIRALFARQGLDPDRPVVTSCGSGVTAAIISLALTSLGKENHRLYDGSWSEWGSLPDTPIVKDEN
ncbi:3-mercaptopyruvate sulfurtransferase [Limoniibacter endophyticus]|uniref:3-mercaptopyruvate sulfurtransferase n=1 Tax=Limoniibacter endophyticus TaxID=1565040 RepID=A0A8J3DJM9_9HYPH|nr:3-mercaptopyruvate sulfurtransferase [Limoniibacter endophyticus]GHC61910.1 sulfurtransferase [Limoniibacter endophyticus]